MLSSISTVLFRPPFFSEKPAKKDIFLYRTPPVSDRVAIEAIFMLFVEGRFATQGIVGKK
jgi:hypothetical protein